MVRTLIFCSMAAFLSFGGFFVNEGRLVGPLIAQEKEEPRLKLPPGVPAKVARVLKYIDENNAAPKGHEGGRSFLNLGRDGEQALPHQDARGRTIKYREWDVNPRMPGKNRGAERLVTGSDRSAFYTADHYRTFTKVR